MKLHNGHLGVCKKVAVIEGVAGVRKVQTRVNVGTVHIKKWLMFGGGRC